MLDMIEKHLFQPHMRSLSNLRLDGDVKPLDRAAIVKKFQEDSTVDVLLLTTAVGGVGLNLTGADTVIMAEHDWNPKKDEQAMNRPHRIGQKKVVTVYRLIMRGTLEERIMGLQQFKRRLASTVIQESTSSFSGVIDSGQIIDLFQSSSDHRTSSAPSSSSAALGVSITGDINSKKSKSTLQQMLDSIGELWDEKQYEDLDVTSFVASLKRTGSG